MTEGIRHRRLRDQYEQLLRPKRHNETTRTRYEKLRRLVVLKGIPPESSRERSTHKSLCSLRGRIWKMLLGVRVVDAQQYVRYVHLRAPVAMQAKIEKDILRTFKNNHDYHQRVSDGQLRRVLNAYVSWIHEGTNECANDSGSGGGEGGLYVQGMNVLAAPFLYVMNELDAYACLCRLLNHHCPQYITKDLRGAHDGALLLQTIVEYIDPELATHLSTAYHGDWGSVTSLPTLLSLSASKPIALSELLKLWDALFACGVHMNVVFTAAHIILLRDRLLAGGHAELQAMLCIQRDLPMLDADLLVTLSLHIVRKLPDDMYQQLEKHPYTQAQVVQ
jgi:cell cycle arrest protein BUB2